MFQFYGKPAAASHTHVGSAPPPSQLSHAAIAQTPPPAHGGSGPRHLTAPETVQHRPPPEEAPAPVALTSQSLGDQPLGIYLKKIFSMKECTFSYERTFSTGTVVCRNFTSAQIYIRQLWTTFWSLLAPESCRSHAWKRFEVGPYLELSINWGQN
jgi:hypothetical protein